MRHIPVNETRGATRQHLVRRLLEQLDRTFAADGEGRAMEAVTQLLDRLDDDNLRAYAYLQGIRAEDEFEVEAEGESRAGPEPAAE
jgi:hypothetical protein